MIRSLLRKVAGKKTTEEESSSLFVYTLPKAGTHLIEGILDEMGIQARVIHCFDPADPGVPRVDPDIRSGLLIRDPRAFFVSLVRHSDRRCREGLEKGVTFPAFRNRATFGPWLEKTFAEKLRMLIELDPDCPYQVTSISDHFRFITKNLGNRNLFVFRFEEIIGERGGGNQRRQVETIENLIEFCGFSARKKDIEKSAEKAWGKSSTFDRGSLSKWRKDFDPASRALFNGQWGHLLAAWGYAL